MRTLFAVFTSIALSAFLKCNAQVKYDSSIEMKYEPAEAKMRSIEREVILQDSSISITNWLNGSSETLYLKVDSTSNKPYSIGRVDGKWHYCTRSSLSGKETKYIVILTKDSLYTSLLVAQKLDEITFIKSIITLKNELDLSKQ